MSGQDDACVLCGLRGEHEHWPHALEIHGALNNGAPATLQLFGCLACRKTADALVPDELCPALLRLPAARCMCGAQDAYDHDERCGAQ